MSTPLVENSIDKATGIVFNISGGSDMTLQEINTISEVVTDMADPSANVIFGAVVDEKFAGQISVTIIATGFTPAMTQRGGFSFEAQEQAPPPPPPPPPQQKRGGFFGR